MCGIFAFVGAKNASDTIIHGLKRLEYRGYDSWGIAVVHNNTIHLKKQIGKIGEITNSTLPTSTIGIGHTRWATTGAVTRPNAHPHFSTDKSFTLAQNGIVENYKELKKSLIKKGYTFVSETDTEVIVRLIEEKLKKTSDLCLAVSSAFKELTGRNTIILLTTSGEIIAVRNGSPLVLGFGVKNEIYLSSDTHSFSEHTQKILVVDNMQLVYVKSGKTHLFSLATNKEIPFKTETIEIAAGHEDKKKFKHYMLKEIYDSPFVLRQLVQQNKKEYEALARAIKRAENVYTIGSGGAGVAASQVAYFLRAIGKVKTISLIGADAEEYKDLFTKNDLIIVISQSGETADVLEVIEPAKKQGVKIASFINMPGSMITRISDFKFMSEAGPEVCVMSTKTFVSQIAWGYLVAKTLEGKLSEGEKNIGVLATYIESYLEDTKNITLLKKLAHQLSGKKDIFLLGKQQNFHIMREGMVKIIEAAYIHGHALPSGDLKHYVITLMQEGVPVIVALSNDHVVNDVKNAIDQVKARGAVVYGISPTPYENFNYFIKIPDTKETISIMNLIPLQLLSYFMAVEFGNNVDRPRNIAKSVTVK